MQQPILSKVWFFLLVNTKSGGGWGRCYLELKKQQFSFQLKKEKIINVKLIDLFDKQKKQTELKKAQQLQANKHNDVRVIICGGDGTIVWGIQECLKADLKFQQLSFACLPIGTGNDFSRTIGWGSNPLKFKENDIRPLKKRIIQWLHAEITQYDVWQVQIQVYDKGQIFVVKNKQDSLLNKKVHKVGFVNYVGIGIDARVSYNFQKNRQSTKLMNLAVYGCFGCLFWCRKIPELSKAVETFQDYQTCDTIPCQSPFVLKQHNLDDSMVEHLTQNQQSRSSRKINFKKGYHGLICLNSISYMAGAMNAWDTKKIGCSQKEVRFQDQKFNDGKIQFIGYKDELRLGLEKMIHTGARIAQGQGPFVIKFKQQSLQHQNYIQIDGQGLKIRGIKQITIKKNEKLPLSKINVMIKKLSV